MRRPTHDDPYLQLLSMCDEPVLLVVEGRIALANDAAALLLGAEAADQLVGQSAVERYPSLAASAPPASTRRRSVDSVLKRIDGSELQVRLCDRPVTWNGRPARQLVVRNDVPAAVADPLTDPLTQLPNRRQFDARLQQALDRGLRNRQPVWVLYFDLDHFHRVNSAHGHRVGDELLLEAATRLQACVRKTDLVASAGGDEFLVALEGTANREGAAVVALRSLEALARPFEIGTARIGLTTSIGVTAFPEDGGDPDRLLRNADIALWQAKTAGRDRHEFFTAQMDASYQRSLHTRAATERKLASLTQREREVLAHLVAGEANKLIAYELGASTRTIEQHRSRIMDKMGAGSLAELVRMVVAQREA